MQRNAGVPDMATVARHIYKPEIGPDAYEAQAFRLRRTSDDIATIAMSSDIIGSEDEHVSVNNIRAANRLEMLLGEDAVSAQMCQDLTRQISGTRVHPIQPTSEPITGPIEEF